MQWTRKLPMLIYDLRIPCLCNSTTMTKIIITGSKGRMGQALIACAAKLPELANRRPD